MSINVYTILRINSEAEELKDVMTDLEEKIEESKQLQSEKDKAEREAALLIRGAFSSIFGQSSAGDQPTAMASSAFPDAASSVRILFKKEKRKDCTTFIQYTYVDVYVHKFSNRHRPRWSCAILEVWYANERHLPLPL